MAKKLLFWIFAVLIFPSIATAFGNISGDWGLETFTGVAGNPSSNWTQGDAPFGLCQLDGNGHINSAGGDCTAKFLYKLPLLSQNETRNISCSFDMAYSGFASNSFFVTILNTSDIYGTHVYTLFDSGGQAQIRTAGTNSIITGWKNDGTWQHVNMTFLQNRTVQVWINNSLRGQSIPNTANNASMLGIYADSGGMTIKADNFTCNWVGEDLSLDTTKPVISSLTLNNTAPKVNQPILFGVNITDETAISSCFFAHNLTSTMSNVSSINISGTLTQLNYTVNITNTMTRSKRLGAVFTCNDTSGNVRQDFINVTIANTNPALTSITGGAKPRNNASVVLDMDFDHFRNSSWFDDNSGNNNNGQIFGVNRSNGYLGYGAVFDGINDYVDAGNGASLQLTNWTLEAWIYRRADSGAGEELVAKADASAWDYVMYIRATDKLDFGFIDTVGGEHYGTSPNNMPLNTWKHVVGTFDGINIKVYEDGVLVKTSADYSAFTPRTSTKNLWIGRALDLYNFNGIIDEVKIYNIALSADEIAKAYSKGRGTGNITTTDVLKAGINTSSDADSDILVSCIDWYKNGIKNATTGCVDDINLTLYMPFEENIPSPSTTADFSQYNNTGTINGAIIVNDSIGGFHAMQFDGVDDFINTSLSETDPTTFTASAWIKPTDVSQVDVIVSHGSEPVDNGWSLYKYSHYLTLTFHGVGNYNSNSNILIANVWQYVAVTLSGTTATFYLNGNQVGTATTGSMGVGTHNYRIGSTSTQNWFNGTIDEVRIYNTSISSNQIRQYYYATKDKFLTLNESETKKNENWNASIRQCDQAQGCTNPINFSYNTMGNIIPNATYITNASNDHDRTNRTLNLSYCYDPDAEDGIDTINYVVYWDLDSTPASLFSNTTLNNFTTNFTSDNIYYFQTKCMDSESESPLSAVWNFTLDTTIPTIPNDNLTIHNNTYRKGNITIFIEAYDVNIFNASINVSKGTVTQEFYYNDTAQAGYLGFLRNLNLTQLNDGKYNITFESVDKHSKAIDKSKVTKNQKNNTLLVFTDNTEGNEINISVNFFKKNEQPITIPSNFKSSSDFDNRSFIITQHNFTVDNPAERQVLTFEINYGKIRIINDDYKGHLLFGKSYGWDTDGTLTVNGIERNYTTAITRISNKKVDVEIIPITDFANNDIVSFTSTTLFGLNNIIRYSEIIIDNTPPTINYFNISGIANNTFTSKTTFNITINASDLKPNTTQIYVNDTANATGTYLNNTDTNVTVTINANGKYRLKIKANDSAGNEVNSTLFYDITIDTITPQVNLLYPLNSSSLYSSSIINFKYNVSEPSKCSLILSNNIIYSDDNSYNDVIANITIFITGNNMEWLVNCTDNANNKNNQSFYITLLQQTAGGGSTGGGGGGGGSFTFSPIYKASNTTQNTSIISASLINDTYIRVVYANGTSENIVYYASLTTGSKFLDIAIPIPHFTIQAISPETADMLKYFLNLKYASQETLSQSAEIIGIRMLSIITPMLIILLAYIGRIASAFARFASKG